MLRRRRCCAVVVKATKASKRPVIPPSLQEVYDKYHYAPGVVVGEKVLLLSGQVGRKGLTVVGDGSADLEGQYTQMFENVKEILPVICLMLRIEEHIAC